MVLYNPFLLSRLASGYSPECSARCTSLFSITCKIHNHASYSFYLNYYIWLPILLFYTKEAVSALFLFKPTDFKGLFSL